MMRLFFFYLTKVLIKHSHHNSVYIVFTLFLVGLLYVLFFANNMKDLVDSIQNKVEEVEENIKENINLN